MLEDKNGTLKQYLDSRALRNRPDLLRPVSREHYLQRCWPVIKQIISRKGKLTVIDAGCGHAYESILFAALGADVIGIDLRQDGFKVALENIEDFRSIFPLSKIRLINRDIFAAMEHFAADIVFVKQAFSHIHPAEKFVHLAYRQLKSNGILVINDSNWINPLGIMDVALERWRHGKLRWFVTEKYRDPVTNAIVPYAVERMMTPMKVKRMLRAAGFLIESEEMTGFIPVSLASQLPRLALMVESVIGRVPILSKAGVEYTITGLKA